MGVFAVRQPLAGGKARGIDEHEARGVTEDLVNYPWHVLFRTMLHDVGADHAVEGAFGQLAVRRECRVVAGDLIDAPVIEHAALAFAVFTFDPDLIVLLALATAVVKARKR